MGSGRQPRHRSEPPYLLLGVLALVLVCCVCTGGVVAYKTWSGASSAEAPTSQPGAAGKTPTATVKGTTAPTSKLSGANGLEISLAGFQRPLQVQGLTKTKPGYQFILVTLSIRNTKTSGPPVGLSPDQFKVKGDGGLTYEANPASVMTDSLMGTEDTVASGKTVERDLVFLVAQDDTGLVLNWTTGGATRPLSLEPAK